MSLTPEQRRAVLTEGRDLCVLAGAGSGKTRVLVERVVHLVTRDEDPHELSRILAITFTIKAAREMRERLAGEFEERGREDLRAQVEWAHVSTIHAFCARLLKENAVEASVDPAFDVMDETRASALVREALDDTVEDWRTRRGAELSELANLYSDSLDDEVIAVHARLRGEGISPNDADVPAAGTESLIEALRAVLESLGRLPAAIGDATAAAAKQARAALEHVPALEALIVGEPAPGAAIEALGALDASFNLRPKGEVGPVLRELRNERIPAARAAAASRLARPALLALRDFLAGLDERYSARKDDLGALDFADLELRSLALLRDRPEVREEVSGRFSQILVDEYQDVNPVQATIIGLLRGAGNHFAVGDVKQSIYGFRHAEPSLFLQASREAGEEGRIPLSRNFRSAPELVEFTNHCFRPLFADGGEDVWTDMDTPEDAPGGGSVQYLLTDGDSADEARAAEAELIAAAISEAVGAGEFAFGEVAVLFRALTNVKTYERALETRGIPYYVVKGRGFYEAREVVDIVRLLECIRNPRDELALAAALRSPFGSLGEDGLLALAEARREGDARLADLLERPSEVEGLAEADRERWLRFASLLGRLRRLAGRGSIREVIETAVDESGYRSAVWLMSGARRRAANIEKVLDLADDLGGVFDLSEFLARLREFRMREVAETEAPTGGEREDVVRLLTVHAAKGLEFPMVVLPDLCRPRTRTTPAILARGGRLASRILLGPGEDPLETSAWRDQKEETRLREDEESLRLLYVAATRAMRRLLLSARDGKAGAGTWWQVLGSILGEDLAFGERGQRVERVEPEAPSGTARGPASLVRRHRERLAEGRPLPGPTEEESEQAGALVTRLSAEPRWAGGTCYQNTISELLLYGSCERCYVERYRLGIPPRARTPVDAFGETERDRPGEDELPPSERGIAVHDVLRVYDPRSPESLEDLARSRLRRYPGGGEELVKDVVAMVRSFYASEIGLRAAASHGVRREAPFLTRWPMEGERSLLLRGQIDLLFPGEDGALTVVDYKTGATPSARYEIQLVAYAMALTSFVDAGVREACIVRLSPDEEARIHRVELGTTARERIQTVAEEFAAFLAAGAPLPPEHATGCSSATGSVPARA